jgi:hypothetical protein
MAPQSMAGDWMADLKDCPFGFDIRNDCKNCDYSDTNHWDPEAGKCVKR